MIRAAAPVPAPRSMTVKGSSAANGSSSASSVRWPARRRSRSAWVDFQKLTPMSDFQTAALVSSLFSGMEEMLTPFIGGVWGVVPRKTPPLLDIEVLPDLRGGHPAVVQA